MVATTPGGALVETVVRVVSAIPDTGGGGGVTSFLDVVATTSAVDVPVVAGEAEVKTGRDTTGRRGTSVVLGVVTTRVTDSEVTSGDVFAVGV